MAVLVTRAVIPSGIPLESPPISVETFKDVRIRLNPLTADFDDPALRITLTILLSFDNGATWGHETTAQIVGGARGKDGLMPSVGVGLLTGPGGQAVAFAAGTLAKVRYQHNLSRRMGLDVETR